MIGKEVGWRNDGGYLVTKIDNCQLSVHRIIYQMYHGEVDDELYIDQQDGVTSNNRIENLHLVTKQGNNKNRKLTICNTSGVVGVTWSKPHEKWKAQIKHAGSNIYLGLFSDKIDAITARKSAELAYDFHRNHGRVVQ